MALTIVALSWIPRVWNAQEPGQEVVVLIDKSGPEALDGLEAEEMIESMREQFGHDSSMASMVPGQVEFEEFGTEPIAVEDPFAAPPDVQVEPAPLASIGATLGGRIKPLLSEWAIISAPIIRVVIPQEVAQT